MGAVALANKYYKPSPIIVTYLAIGFLLPVSWCILCITSSTYFGDEPVLTKFIIISITVFYIAVFSLLFGIYVFIDTSFALMVPVRVGIFHP